MKNSFEKVKMDRQSCFLFFLFWEGVPRPLQGRLTSQGRKLKQRHCFESPRSRGVGTSRVAGPLATSLRRLSVERAGRAATQELTN